MLTEITQVVPDGQARRIGVRAGVWITETKVGDSIAVNGACLTVIEKSGEDLFFQSGPETLSKTNLGALRTKDSVNLERALQVGARVGGHFVQGHVDGIGRIRERRHQGDWQLTWFSCPPDLTRQMVPKGSIAVDGVSLTLVDVTSDAFSVALIPHTLQCTTLGHKQVGDTVNLETDLLAKYVLKSLDGGGLAIEHLQQAGFLPS